MQTKFGKMNFYVSALLFLALIVGLAMPMQTAKAATLNVDNTTGECNDTTGAPYYCTIQAAITAAAPGDTINVAAGTYSGNIIIDRSVIILGDPGDSSPGPGSNAPLIDGGSLPGDAFLIANGVSNVTIQGFEISSFTSNDTGIGNGISAWVGSTSNITIQDNYFHNLGYNGVLVGNDKSSNPLKWGDHTNWTIKGNTLETFEAYGFELTNASNSSIENNIIHSNATWNLAATCIMVDARRNASGIVIKGNQLDGEMYAGYPAIYVFANSFETPNVNLNDVLIEDNIILTTSSTGTAQVTVYNYTGTGTVTGVHVHGNSLTTFRNGTPAAVDATANWWGTADAATIATQITGSGAAVVDFSPWYIDAAKTTLAPVHNVTKDTYHLTIQAAIDAAADGDTINVAAGTYDSTINIVNRHNLTLVGEDKLTTIIKSSSVIGWGLGYGTSRNTVVRVETSTGITLQNFTIDLDLVKGNNVTAYLGWDSTGTLDNNIIKNSSRPDSEGYYYELGVYLRAPGYTDVSRATYAVTNNTFYNMGRVALVTHGYLNTTISGNTFYKDMADFGYAIEMGSASTGSINNNIIYGYNTPAASDGSNSAGIYIENSFTSAEVSAITKNVTIDNNEIYNSQWALYMGNEFDGYAGNVDILASITGNNFHDNVDGAVLVTDEDKAAGSSVTANFTDNILTNNGETGYYLYTWGDGDLTVNIQGGSITGHDVGVYMNDFASGPTASSYNVKVENAKVTGNTTYGVQNEYTGAVLDASPIWWGAASGPGDKVSANVSYTPWCANEACNNPPPPLPSSFYGEIHINDTPPIAGQYVEAYIDGITGPAATVAIKGAAPLTYMIKIAGDLLGTPAKDGGEEGDLITFKINGRVVATGYWHSGTSVSLNFHPPEALPGGPYSGDEGSAISFSGSANDWGIDATTYQWDLDNNGSYETTSQTPSHTWANDGIYIVGLKVTDAQGGVGTTTFEVTVNNVVPSVDAGGPYAGNEGALISFTGTASDPADTLTYEWDFDYVGSTFTVDASGSLTPTHAYANDGTYTVALRVSDDDTSVIDTATVTVSNVAPSANAGGPYAGNEGALISFTGTASDPADTLTYEWDFDYVGSTFTVDASPNPRLRQ
jgi:PKD repeat protein